MSNDRDLRLMQRRSTTLQLLEYLCDEGVLRSIDLEFGRFIWQQEIQNTVSSKELDMEDVQLKSAYERAELASKYAALVSHYLGQGHVCIKFSELISTIRQTGTAFCFDAQKSEGLLNALGHVSFRPEEEIPQLLSCTTISESRDKPLLLERSANNLGCLYLNRYWHYEAIIADFVTSSDVVEMDADVLSEVLAALFPSLSSEAEHTQTHSKIDAIDYQKLAAAVALTSSLSVITGGPGTGKTYTVVRLLAALILYSDKISESNHKRPVIRLAAPTGKAAARMLESIRNALDSLPLSPEQKAAFPDSASTLHRLLGSLPLDANFKHNKHNPLHLDILIIDEASMIDLPMMAKLLDAMPERGRVVLLGDRDQLASVEAGSVLSDVCQRLGNYSPERANQLTQLTGFELHSDPSVPNGSIQDSLAWLKISRRFGADSGIGALAYAINSGSPIRVKKVLEGEGFPEKTKSVYEDIHSIPLSEQNYHKTLNQVAKDYQPYIVAAQKQQYEQALKLFNHQRLLCALREGEYGVQGLNESIKRRLEKLNIISPKSPTLGNESPIARDSMESSEWYVGRPIMVLRNDHALGLYNGDIGLVMEDEKNRLRVYFEAVDGLKSVLPSRMPEHETAYAMTVHKSQGSEFKHTVLVLPNKLNPVLTRELIYTGVTRAKEALTLLYDAKVLNEAVQQRVIRHSGLADKLFRQSNEPS